MRPKEMMEMGEEVGFKQGVIYRAPEVDGVGEKLAGIGGVAVDPADLAAAAHAREDVVGGDGLEGVEASGVGAGWCSGEELREAGAHDAQEVADEADGDDDGAGDGTEPEAPLLGEEGKEEPIDSQADGDGGGYQDDGGDEGFA